MNRLYHYTTWPGEHIRQSGIIKPAADYSRFAQKPMPTRVFLTENPFWEPSIQAVTRDYYWEKCGSCPEAYTEMGIPCWRFLIEHAGVYYKMWKNDFDAQMFEDALALGSDTEQWWVSFNPVKFEAAWRFKDARWTLV